MIKNAILTALGARLGLELDANAKLVALGRKNNETTKTKDIMGAVNALEYVDSVFFEQGVVELERIGVPRETILKNITIIDENVTGYTPIKGLSKLIRLVAFLGGATDNDICKGCRCRELLDNFQRLVYRCCIDTATEYQQRGWYKKVVSCHQKFNQMKLAVGYRVALEDASIMFNDEVMGEIIKRHADYSTTSINTQVSQIKTLLSALNLITVVDDNGVVVDTPKYNRGTIVYDPAFIQLLVKLDNRHRIIPRLASMRG